MVYKRNNCPILYDAYSIEHQQEPEGIIAQSHEQEGSFAGVCVGFHRSQKLDGFGTEFQSGQQLCSSLKKHKSPILIVAVPKGTQFPQKGG